MNCMYVHPKNGTTCTFKAKCEGLCGKHKNIPQCAICFEYILSEDKFQVPECNHAFHKGCIQKWKRQNDTCPTCRGRISIKHPEVFCRSVEMSAEEAYNILVLMFIEDYHIPFDVYDEAIRVFSNNET